MQKMRKKERNGPKIRDQTLQTVLQGNGLDTGVQEIQLR